MNSGVRALILILFLAAALGAGFFEKTSAAAESPARVTAIRMAKGIDENYAPIEAVKSFPAGTSKMVCWFSWKDATPGSQITAHWQYVDENIAILNYPFTVPRRQGSGGVAITMPSGKTFPPGLYEVLLESDQKAYLKKIRFKVLGK